MPFTLSHAAAVLPFRKYFREILPFSALIIGSFSPDFRYFLPGVRIRIFSHSPEGLFLFCLPLGLLALAFFHYIAKEPLFYLLPKHLQLRIEPRAMEFSFLPFRKAVAIIIALLIGGLSHIIWDSFTHANGWAVEKWRFLNYLIYQFPVYNLTVFKLLQHLSTVGGILLLAFWFWHWYRRTPKQDSSSLYDFPEKLRWKIVFLLISCTGIFGLCYGFLKAVNEKGFEALQIFLIHTVVGCMMGATIWVLFYSLIFKLFTRKFSQEPAEDG
jgi:hypothetical protein